MSLCPYSVSHKCPVHTPGNEDILMTVSFLNEENGSAGECLKTVLHNCHFWSYAAIKFKWHKLIAFDKTWSFGCIEVTR